MAGTILFYMYYMHFTCFNSINCKAIESIIFLVLEKRKLRHMEISDLAKVI